jgi:hypothetical protein
MFEVKWQKKTFAGLARRALLEMVTSHRAELLREWEAIHP